MTMRKEREVIVRQQSYSYLSAGATARDIAEQTTRAETNESVPAAPTVPTDPNTANGLWKQPAAFFERKIADDRSLTMPDGQSVTFRNFCNPQIPTHPSAILSPLIRIREGQQAQIKLETRQRKQRPIMQQGQGISRLNLSLGVCLESVESHIYQWQPRNAGTWFYQSHASTAHQFEMGLYGVIVVDAEPDQYGRPCAYRNGPTYDVERFWVFDDVDPAWHASELDSMSAAQDSRLQKFKPKYFLINGVPNTEVLHHPDVAIEAKLGDKVLLRLMNASFSLVKVEIERLNADIVSVDGNALGSEERPWTHWISVAPQQPVRLATASRHDLLIDLDPALGGVEGPGEYKVTIEFLDGARRQVHNVDADHPAHVGRATTTIRVL